MHTFQLYRLRVTCKHTIDGRKVLSNIANGASFEVSGENLIFNNCNQSFPLYALAGLLPLLPAKQRPTDAADWMTTDAVIADPDPHNGLVYVIERLQLETFKRADVTAVPMEKDSANA